MNQFDIALKSLLQRQLQTGFIARLTGLQIAEWLPTELPEVRTRHVDLLGRTPAGDLVHIEFQSRNDPRMALRMAEYALAILRRHRTVPRQLVIYVGERPLRMPASLEGPGWSYFCQIIDIRDIPTADLMASPNLEDNILAVLTRLSNSGDTIREILHRIGTGPAEQRAPLLAELLLLAGLRQLRVIMKRELERMSVLIDINRHTIFGPIHREGVKEGIEKGLEQGIEKGIEKGIEQGIEKGLAVARNIALSLLSQRFGKVPPVYQQRVRSMDLDEIQTLSSRLFQAASLKELLS